MNNPSRTLAQKKVHHLMNVPETTSFWFYGAVLLVICIVTYGLLIPSLGYYWDDWPAILLAKTNKLSSFWQYTSYDRPLSAWTYIAGTWLLGTKPANWHIFTLLMRWTTVFIFFGLLNQIWPSCRKINFWTAALLAVYPAFNLQPIALTFSQHFITSTFFMLSMLLMVQAIRKPVHRVWLFIAALLCQIIHLVTVEYFIGLELLRPAVIFLLLAEEQPPWKKRSIKTFFHWLPFALILSGFVLWRLFIFQVEIDPNAPRLLYSLQSDLSGTLVDLINISVRDFLHVVLLSWQNTLLPDSLLFNDRFTLFSWLIAALLFSTLLGISNKYWFKDHSNNKHNQNTSRLGIGIYATLVGFIPTWFTGRDMFSGLYGTRFALPAMIGASVLIAGLVHSLLRTERQKVVLFCLLISLSAGYHLRNANVFRLDWQAQKEYYWQLFWRAPQLEKGAAIFTNGTLSKYVGNYSSASAINTLYTQSGNELQDHWVFEFGRDFSLENLDEYLNGIFINGSMRSISYSGTSRDVLVIVKPVDYCLWTLTPELKNIKGISTSYREFYSLTNLDVISYAGGPIPNQDIFGPELEHSWCYYYQKIELASQEQDWGKVIMLWQQAKELGLEPKNRFELISVINAYARLCNWQQAQELTIEGSRIQFRVKDAYCDLWKTLEADTPYSLDKDESLSLIFKRLPCK